MVLQIRNGLDLLDGMLAALETVLASLARRHRDTIISAARAKWWTESLS